MVPLLMVHREPLPRGRLQEPQPIIHALHSTTLLPLQPQQPAGLPPLPLPRHRPGTVENAAARNHGQAPAPPALLVGRRERSRGGLELHPLLSRCSPRILELGPLRSPIGRMDHLPDALPSRP